jgi:hypothetical protein
MALKLRFRPLFPAVVVAESPIVLEKVGNVYTFTFDMDEAPTGPAGATGATGAAGAGYGGTSATSLLIANSTTKVFTTQAGLAYQVGNYIRASSSASGTNYMEGLISGYSGTTLSLAVTAIGGSGTFADWVFQPAGVAGAGDMLAANNLSELANKNTALNTLASGLLQNFLSGLGLANNGADATNDIDISAGAAMDSTNVAIMKLSSAITKRLDAAWAVGTNQGGLDTGAIANTTYHIWLIQRSDTGVTDALFSTSASAPTMPASYDRKRRIGSVVRTGAALKAFVQDGNEFKWTTPVADVNAVASLGITQITQTLTLPVGVRVKAFGAISLNVDTTTNLRIADLSTTDLDPATTVNAQLRVSTASTLGGIQWSVFTNASAQIGVRLSATGAAKFMSLLTEGWVDTRGQ